MDDHFHGTPQQSTQAKLDAALHRVASLEMQIELITRTCENRLRSQAIQFKHMLAEIEALVPRE